MHPFRVLFLGLLLLLSILSKHAGLNEAPFSAQRGGFVGKISSEFGEAPFNVQQGELVGTLDATLWPIARWGCPPMKYAARTHVGSEYYLRHLRTSACGTRARTGPRSWRRFPLRRLGESDNERQSRPHRRFLKKENKRKRKAERRRGSDKECGRRGRKHATGKPIGKPPTLTSIGTIYVYGGGLTRKQQRAASTSQYGSLIKSFCQRTNRKRVQESGDGHCGVRSLWRQFDAATGKKTASINSEHIRSGREKLATALRTHSKSIITVLKQIYGGTGGITSHEIEERAKLHRICDAASVCDSTYYVGGFHAVDLIAWAMETGRAVYMIKKDECMVEVFEPFEPPCAIKLEAASPSNEVTVMEYSGNHFDSFITNTRPEVQRVVRKCDMENCTRGSRGASGKFGEHGGGQRCEEAGCGKLARSKSAMCGEHGAGPRCEEAGCGKLARSKSAICGEHGGGPRCEEASCGKFAPRKMVAVLTPARPVSLPSVLSCQDFWRSHPRRGLV